MIVCSVRPIEALNHIDIIVEDHGQSGAIVLESTIPSQRSSALRHQ